MLEQRDRRQYARVTPVHRIRGTVDRVPVVVVDLAMNGIRVAHQEPLPEQLAYRLVFEHDGRRASFGCTRVRSHLERAPRTAFDKPLYHTAFAVRSAERESHLLLRELIEECVVRALDEQKANARGIPAVAAQSFQTGRTGDQFLRCELLPGQVWRQTVTDRTEQPLQGFTVACTEGGEKVAMLCRAYEGGDGDARKLIRTFAALSISKAEGIPTRRYTP